MADKTSAILAYCDAIGWGIHPIIDVFEDRALSLSPCFPTVAPDQLRLDGFEARFHHGIEAPIFVKERFELTLRRRVGCIFLGPCSVFKQRMISLLLFPSFVRFLT